MSDLTTTTTTGTVGTVATKTSKKDKLANSTKKVSDWIVKTSRQLSQHIPIVLISITAVFTILSVPSDGIPKAFASQTLRFLVAGLCLIDSFSNLSKGKSSTVAFINKTPTNLMLGVTEIAIAVCAIMASTDGYYDTNFRTSVSIIVSALFLAHAGYNISIIRSTGTNSSSTVINTAIYFVVVVILLSTLP